MPTFLVGKSTLKATPQKLNPECHWKFMGKYLKSMLYILFCDKDGDILHQLHQVLKEVIHNLHMVRVKQTVKHLKILQLLALRLYCIVV